MNYALCIAFTSACGIDLEEYNGVKSMTAGGNLSGSYTVALKNDGTVWAWGFNGFYGQLGDGTQIDKTTPVQVKGKDGVGFLEDVDAVFAGEAHTVALKNDGTVWAWGFNDFYGQLGDGASDGVTHKRTPVQVKGGASGDEFLKDVIKVFAGGYHTLAITRDGKLWAWGRNSTGQLGYGTGGTGAGINIPTPVQVKGKDGVGFLEDVIKVFAGGSHTLAITGDGKLWTWGYNQFGQLGNDTIPTGTSTSGNISYSPTPVRVKGGTSGDEFLEGVSEVFASANYTVAIKNDGTLWAWGENNDGQLGNGNTSWYSTPVQEKSGATDWVSVSGGNRHTIALKMNGTIWAWGRNVEGQLGKGDGYSANNSENWEPKKLGEASDLIGVAGGYNHSAAIRRSGIVWTWGSNGTGQLGDNTVPTTGTNNYRSKPGVVRWK